jgi:hypothetical protein
VLSKHRFGFRPGTVQGDSVVGRILVGEHPQRIPRTTYSPAGFVGVDDLAIAQLRQCLVVLAL